MRRIDTINRARNLFGSGKDGFTDGVPGTSALPTYLNGAWFNAVQEELANVLEKHGFALQPDQNDQLSKLLRVNKGRTAKEAANGVTPVNIGYEPGDVCRYGDVDLTGVNSCSNVVAIAAASGHDVLFTEPGIYSFADIALTQPGVRIDWSKEVTLRQADRTKHMFRPLADRITIEGRGPVHGTAIDETTNTFFVFTDGATPARWLTVRRVRATGSVAGQGFNNFVKLDSGCDFGEVVSNEVRNLVGSSDGRGYGLLVGDAKGVLGSLNKFYGGANSGRHAVYFSGGASYCKATLNYVNGFVYDAFTQFSQGGQPPCQHNQFIGNVAEDCATLAALSSGSYSVMGHSRFAKFLHNVSVRSRSCGIKVDGTNFSDLEDTLLEGNLILDSGFNGIDIIAAPRGRIIGGLVKDSSTRPNGDGVSSNVRFSAAVGVAADGWRVSGVSIPASARARSGIEVNATPPVPADLGFDGNDVGVGTSGLKYEFAGNAFPVDGKVLLTVDFDPASLGPGAVSAPVTFAMPGAKVGWPVVVGHTGDHDGVSIAGRIAPAGTARVWLVNHNGAAKDVPAGTLTVCAVQP